MKKTIQSYYGPIEDPNLKSILDFGLKQSLEVINNII